jgi:hypothetical protein
MACPVRRPYWGLLTVWAVCSLVVRSGRKQRTLSNYMPSKYQVNLVSHFHDQADYTHILITQYP